MEEAHFKRKGLDLSHHAGDGEEVRLLFCFDLFKDLLLDELEVLLADFQGGLAFFEESVGTVSM